MPDQAPVQPVTPNIPTAVEAHGHNFMKKVARLGVAGLALLPAGALVSHAEKAEAADQAYVSCQSLSADNGNKYVYVSAFLDGPQVDSPSSTTISWDGKVQIAKNTAMVPAHHYGGSFDTHTANLAGKAIDVDVQFSASHQDDHHWTLQGIDCAAPQTTTTTVETLPPPTTTSTTAPSRTTTTVHYNPTTTVPHPGVTQPPQTTETTQPTTTSSEQATTSTEAPTSTSESTTTTEKQVVATPSNPNKPNTKGKGGKGGENAALVAGIIGVIGLGAGVEKLRRSKPRASRPAH